MVFYGVYIVFKAAGVFALWTGRADLMVSRLSLGGGFRLLTPNDMIERFCYPSDAFELYCSFTFKLYTISSVSKS